MPFLRKSPGAKALPASLGFVAAFRHTADEPRSLMPPVCRQDQGADGAVSADAPILTA